MRKFYLVSCLLFVGIFVSARPVFSQITLPPTDRIETHTFVVFNGKLRELVIKGDRVWWRDSADTTEKNLPATWSSKSLAEAWPASVSPVGHPLPVSGIDAHAYQRFPGCGNFANFVTEIVIKGNEEWYRRSSDITGSDLGSKVFTYTTLPAVWGNSGPPTDFIDALNYDIFDGNPRELVLKGSNVWYRTINCANSQLSGWSQVSLSSAWGSNLNPPPLTGAIDTYATDYAASDNSWEIVTQGSRAWARRSFDTNSHHESDVWRPMTLSDLWQRNSLSLSDSDIASRFIDKFMSIYGNTDFSAVINYPYASTFDSQNNFRALMGQALAHTVKYRLSNNASVPDLTKAKNYLNATLDHYSMWGKDFLSEDIIRSTLLTSWIIWDQLSDTEKTKIYNTAKTDADYWTAKLAEAQAGGPFLSQMNHDWQNPKSQWYGNTSAEENGGVVAGLALTAAMYPNDPSAGRWEQAARCFAFHTITTGETACGITTTTVANDFSLANHGFFPSVVYTLAALSELDQAGLGYYLGGYQIPSELHHNTIPLWSKFFTYFHPGDYTIYKQYFRGQDWGDIDVWLAMTDFNYFPTIDNSSGLSPADTANLATDIMHYFYTIKKDGLRFPEAGPVISMPVTGATTSNWFQNSLTHAKGAAEIIIYQNPGFFFCNGNVDRLGRSTHLCNPTVPVKTFSAPIPGDLTGDFHVTIADLQALLSSFTNIFNYNLVVANFGK